MKTFLLLPILASLVAGCAGRAANPVMAQQYGDNAKSCAALEQDMAFVDSEVQRLVPKTEKTGSNVALGVTGAFFIVPLFFMDFSQAEQIEVNAYRQRYNHLVILATEKGCDTQRKVIQPQEQPKTTQADNQSKSGSEL